MIVWGGVGSGYTQTGGRLRLDTLPDVDADLDGYGICSGDCDDGDASIHPGATETCNGLDDNCATGIDETFDQDQDGFTSCGGDCNDTNAAINPAAPEVCNHVDDNCNSSVDEGYPDVDADGYAACVDCNDFDRTIHPGSLEVCDGVDNNCDGTVDEGGSALCDFDPDDCLTRTCGGASGCLTTFRPSGSPCTDFNACTQGDTCNSSGQCLAGSPVVCTPLDTCHLAGTCSSSSGCSNPAKPIGSSCDDGNACTAGETCNAGGVCGGGTLMDNDLDGHFNQSCGGDDCDDSNASVWAPPQEVTNLTVTAVSPANPTWDSQAAAAGPGTLYDLTSGTLDGSGKLNKQSAVCLQSSSTSINYSDGRPSPTVGSGYWYLSRARNTCSVGTYGFASGGTERSIMACP